MDPLRETQAARRARISYACEACRAAKVKCQPSNHPGICKRCSDSKRECIFKTGPRTRRPRTKRVTSTPSTPRPTAPPPPGPSRTFTIDVPVEDEFADVAGNLESLRLNHEMYVEDFLSAGPDEYASYSEYSDEEDEVTASSPHHRTTSIAGTSSASHASSLPVGASASTPPSSVSLGGGAAPTAFKGKRKGALASLGVRPQFNLDSAEKLLAEFDSRMLLHFPAVAPTPSCLQGDDGEGAGADFSVPRLAQTKPFVLLAILAAASGSRTLQGHSLYDDEFRKILGLKFVAGGERSLELLQGLVVYTAWYPFHLRPKNKQAFQYIRMVVDMVTDLELDQDPDGGDELPPQRVSAERLEQARAYLATFYIVSSFAEAWNKTPALYYTPYTAKCCALLERDSTVRGDHVLAWLVRVQRIIEEVSGLRKTRTAAEHSEYQISLMLKGMEAQLEEWRGRMPPEVASTPSIRLALLFTRVFIPAAPLLKLPMPKTVKRTPPFNQTQPSTPGGFAPDAARLATVVPDVRAFFDWILTLPATDLNSFSGTEWARFILVVILAFRLSFPIADCPGWDDGWARDAIGFGEYLRRFESMGDKGAADGGTGGGAGTVDVVGASKVVLDVVRKKWEKRAERMDRARNKGKASDDVGMEKAQGQQQQPGSMAQMHMDLGVDIGMDPMVLDKTMHGCPMIDGSLDAYYPIWDESFSSPGLGMSSGMAAALDLPGGGGIDGSGGPQMPGNEYVDIWGTMTSGWAQWPQIEGGFDGGDVPG